MDHSPSAGGWRGEGALKTRKIRILIVEDHPIVRRGLRETLAEAFPHASFGEATEGREALVLCREQEWDIVTLDIKIPGIDGFGLLDELRRLRPRPQVLVVSAYPAATFAVRAIKGGAAGYLAKSQAPDELVAAVERILQGGKYVTAEIADQLADALSHGNDTKLHDGLSHRELQVLRLVANGRTSKAIATEMGLSEKTIATYRSRIANKTGISTSVGLTRYALQHGLA